MSKQLSTNSLPPKELSIFKRVVRYYDQKQYKNGLKYAKQILSNPKFAEHGETLAMKGILLSCLGKKEEAQEYVKRGLKANISSFVCWHIYGLVQKADRKYDEAIKCYLQALRLEPENLEVLRDLAVLQMQLRNYEGCKDTRYKLLMLRPSQRASWIGYALINHLLQNYDTAITVLNEFRKAQGDVFTSYENSELILYQAMIFLENKKYEEALKLLTDMSKDIVDVVSLLEMKAKIFLAMGQRESALDCALELIDRNPENEQYFDLLCNARGADSSSSIANQEIRRKTFEEILEKYPRSGLARRLFLGLCSGDEFKTHLDAYLRRYLRKGAPPLFIQLTGLWKDEEKLNILDNLLFQYRSNMASFHTFDGPDGQPEPPSTAIWLSYFIAQYLNFKKCYKEALDVVDDQLKKTPTLVDFYVLKANIYYSAGDVITASRWMEEAQSLDTADRYINAHCTKFMVEAHRQDDAIAMASKFTRGTISVADYLSEMQCMWFLIENARTYRDIGKYGESLKLCHEVEQHYKNILDDQLDFHSYCLRKGTLRSYVESLRLEDRLRNDRSYFDIAQLATEIYLHLHSQPLDAGDDNADGDKNSISSSEAKKLRSKQRKAARKAEAEAARARAEQERREQAARSRQTGSEENDPDRPMRVDSFLDPHTLARPADPLEEASKFLRPLLELSPKNIEIQCLAYEVSERKNKLLLMLKAIKLGKQVEGSEDHPWFHCCYVRFLIQMRKYVPILAEGSDSPVHKVLTTQLPLLFEGWPYSVSCSPTEVNERFINRNSNSFPHIFRAMFLRCFIEPEKRLHHLANLPLPSSNLENSTWQSCAEALKLLRTAYTTTIGPVDAATIEKYRLACRGQHPMANAFLTAAERNELRLSMVEAASATAVCGVYVNYETEADVFRPTNHQLLLRPLGALSISGEKLVNGDAGDISDTSPCKAPVNNVKKQPHNLDPCRTQVPTSTC